MHLAGSKNNVKNIAEMSALAKADPSSTNFGSSGNGTVPHFLGIMMGDAAGIAMNHVPFQGGAQAMNALLGGHVGYTMDVVTEALEQHRSGKARIIAVAGGAVPRKCRRCRRCVSRECQLMLRRGLPCTGQPTCRVTSCSGSTER